MTTPKPSPAAHDICIHPNDMHRHTCHSRTSAIDLVDAAARRDSRATGMYVFIHVSAQCFCSYALMWEANTRRSLSKAVIGRTTTLKVFVLPCPCLHQELLTNYSLAKASRMGHWQGQNPPTTRRAQPSEQLRHAAMLSLQKRGTARKPKMR